MKSTISQHLGITIVSALTIIFGLAEVATAFTHNFFGVVTSGVNIFTYSAAIIGIFYVVAGLLILTMKKAAAGTAILLLVADIIGRIVLVMTGLFPTNSPKQIFSMIAGTVIVAVFAIYIGLKRESFK